MKKNNYFKYIVIAAVILIPFMYSFFYLKAYSHNHYQPLEIRILWPK